MVWGSGSKVGMVDGKGNWGMAPWESLSTLRDAIMALEKTFLPTSLLRDVDKCLGGLVRAAGKIR